MDVHRYGFLRALLGEDGAQALAKAAERSPALAPVLIPRVILSWLALLDRDGAYERDLPGVENSYFSMQKTDSGYTGVIAVGDASWGFEAASALHLAASIGVALGVDTEDLDPALRNLDLQRLGKSVDLLVKARAAAEQLGKRQLDPNAGYTFSHDHTPSMDLDSNGQSAPVTSVYAFAPGAKQEPGGHIGHAIFRHNPNGTIESAMTGVEEEHQRRGVASAMYAHAQKVTGKQVVPSVNQTDEGRGLWAGNAKAPQFGTAKAEAAGPAAAPQKQGAPQGPTGAIKQPKLPVPRPPPSVKLSLSQASQACPVCGLPQFHGERLVGCLCFGELAKTTRAERTLEGFTLTFGPEWDAEALDVFLESLVPAGRAVPRR